MLKRISALSLIIIGLLLSASFPGLTTYAQSKPGACAKLPAATPAATVAATKAAAAAPTATATTAPAAGTTSIAINGGFGLYPLAQKWGEEYSKLHPEVQFDIQAAGAGVGVTQVLAGQIEIALLTREPAKAETDKGLTVFPAAIDAVVFTINTQNPVLSDIQSKGLSCATLQKIFITGEITTWGQAVGTADSTAINVYGRADSAGAADQIAKYLGGTGQADLKGTGVQGDPGLIEAVLKDPNGIGFNNIAYAYDPSSGNVVDGAAVVPLDQNGDSKIDTDEAVYATHKDITAAIAVKKYPWPPSRQNYLATKGTPSGAVLDFIKWTLTDGQQYVEDAGYVKTPADLNQKALGSLK